MMKEHKGELGQFSKRLALEAFIKSGIFALTIGFAVSLVIIAATTPVIIAGGLWVIWLALGLLPVTAGVSGFLLYRKYFRVSQKQVAARVDGMGLEQRVITAMELEDDDSFIARKLKEDTSEKLKSVTPKRMKLAFKKWPFIALAAAGLAAVFSMSYSAVVAASVRETLATPSQFEYVKEEKAVFWKRVPYADTYHISLRTPDDPRTEPVLYSENDAKLDVSDLEAGNYVITVYAKARNYNQSETAEYGFKILSAQEELINKLLGDLNSAISQASVSDQLRADLTQIVSGLSAQLKASDPILKTVAQMLDASSKIHSLLDGAQPVTIVFEANNGRGGDNVQLKRIPPNEGLNKKLQDIINGTLDVMGYPNSVRALTESDIPGEPRKPQYRLFGGWAVKSDESETILTNSEILAAIAGGETTFIAIWYDDNDLIEQMLAALRKTINSATISQGLKDDLLAVVDALEARLPTAGSINEKVEFILETRQEIIDILEAFPVVDITFDSNNGIADETVVISKKQPYFVKKDIPPDPLTAPVEGLFFWGWIAAGDESETLLTKDEIMEAVANGVYDFVAIWGDAEIPLEDDSEPDESDDPLEDQLTDIIDDTVSQLEDMEDDSDDGSDVNPDPNELFGDMIINGETPYTDVWDEFYANAMEQLANGNLPPELREFLELYFGML